MNLQSQIENARQNGWLDYYREAAEFYDIPVEILLAKDSRESWLGLYPGLQKNGWIGSDGVSKGISQVNISMWPFARQTDPSDVKAFVALGAEILKDELDRFSGNMNAALAAYNSGAGNVRSALNNGKHPDSVTTDGDYSRNVIERSKDVRRILGGTSLVPLSIQETTKANFPIITIGLLMGAAAATVIKTNQKRKS